MGSVEGHGGSRETSNKATAIFHSEMTGLARGGEVGKLEIKFEGRPKRMY